MHFDWLDRAELDRLPFARTKHDEVEALWRSPEARVLGMVGTKHVMDGSAPRVFAVSELTADVRPVLLGRAEGAVWFYADVPETGFPGESLADLRRIGPTVGTPMANLLALARALAWWHERNGFCSVCGHETQVIDAGFRRRCPSCEADHHPRVDAAMIVLVHHEDACLLARSPRFPPSMYSALAGFVEPGESLERCVAREVWEEVGVEVEEVQYVASQPWPFPQSLMVGFLARAKSRALTLDEAEIEDAMWIPREVMADPSRWDGFTTPPPFAIAHHLIQTWTGGAPKP